MQNKNIKCSLLVILTHVTLIAVLLLFSTKKQKMNPSFIKEHTMPYNKTPPISKSGSSTSSISLNNNKKESHTVKPLVNVSTKAASTAKTLEIKLNKTKTTNKKELSKSDISKLSSLLGNTISQLDLVEKKSNDTIKTSISFTDETNKDFSRNKSYANSIMANCSKDISKTLQQKLILPEHGELILKIKIAVDGSIEEYVIETSSSKENSEYLLSQIKNISFAQLMKRHRLTQAMTLRIKLTSERNPYNN